MVVLKKNIYLILTILITVVAILPLLHQGFFPMHDNEQVARLFELNFDVKSLHIPPRLAPDLGFGYDYPFFNFYPSFVYYIAEIFVLLGFGYIASIKIMIAIGFLLASIFMYLFSKEYIGETGGLVAAILYTYSPYHSVDVYVRGALPEFWTFVFIPIIFYCYKKLKDTEKIRYFIFSGVLSALLILTHNLIAMMSAIFIGIYVLYLIYQSENRKKITLMYAGSLILGLLLSAYFWIPSYFERKYTMIQLLTSELADYKLHFVYLKQFWNSAWGYGGSTYGLADGLSFQIGKMQILLASVTALILSVLFVARQKINKIFPLFFLMLLISIFMQTHYSEFIWDHLQSFSYIQFPWRFMLFTAFFISFFGGASVNFIKNKYIKAALLLVIFFGTTIFAISFFRPSEFLTSSKDADYTNLKTIKWDISSLSFEYVPYGIATKIGAHGNTIVDISKDDIQKKGFTPKSNDLIVKEIKNLPQEKEFWVDSVGPGKLQINTYSFPGWTVYINNEKVKYDDNNKLKLIQVDVPSGKSIVVAKFENTTIRTMSNFLSLLGIILLFFITGFYLFRDKKNEKNKK